MQQLVKARKEDIDGTGHGGDFMGGVGGMGGMGGMGSIGNMFGFGRR